MAETLNPSLRTYNIHPILWIFLLFIFTFTLISLLSERINQISSESNPPSSAKNFILQSRLNNEISECVLAASEYASYQKGMKNNGEAVEKGHNNPDLALSRPDNRKMNEYVSLGFEGELVLVVFDSSNLIDVKYLDISESSPNNASCEKNPEKAQVYISGDDANWTDLGSGCNSFQIPVSEIASIQSQKIFVKIVDKSDPEEFPEGEDGYDVHGILVHGVCAPAQVVVPTNTDTPMPVLPDTLTPTATADPTFTFTPSPSFTPTIPPTITLTFTPSWTITASPTSTLPLTPSSTITVTPSKTPTITPTVIPSITHTITPSKTYTSAPIVKPSATLTSSRTPLVTFTPTQAVNNPGKTGTQTSTPKPPSEPEKVPTQTGTGITDAADLTKTAAAPANPAGPANTPDSTPDPGTTVSQAPSTSPSTLTPTPPSTAKGTGSGGDPIWKTILQKLFDILVPPVVTFACGIALTLILSKYLLSLSQDIFKEQIKKMGEGLLNKFVYDFVVSPCLIILLTREKMKLEHVLKNNTELMNKNRVQVKQVINNKSSRNPSSYEKKEQDGYTEIANTNEGLREQLKRINNQIKTINHYRSSSQIKNKASNNLPQGKSKARSNQ